MQYNGVGGTFKKAFQRITRFKTHKMYQTYIRMKMNSQCPVTKIYLQGSKMSIFVLLMNLSVMESPWRLPWSFQCILYFNFFLNIHLTSSQTLPFTYKIFSIISLHRISLILSANNNTRPFMEYFPIATNPRFSLSWFS
jgi:hypothetical protein